MLMWAIMQIIIQPKPINCPTPQDIIQQCDDLRMSLDNLSESCFRE